jgi:hypothetical protein
MKRTLLSALAFTTLMMPAALAQITYEYADLPIIGNQITRYRDTMTVYGPGPAGAAQQWSFPAPVQHETITTSVVAPSATPHAAQFGSSNMAMTNDNAAYLFFNVNASNMRVTGAAGDLLANGGNVVAVFNPDLTIHNLPRNYADNSDDTYYFEAIANNIPIVILGVPTTVHSARLRHYGHVYDTTDGYGQITTPVGTYDCLRVKSTELSVDSVWTKLFSFSQWTLQAAFTGPSQSTSYSWLAKETKLAVAELTFDTLGNPKNFTWSSVPPLATGMEEASSKDIRIYPQPANGIITIETASESFAAVELLTIEGRVVRTINVRGRNRTEMDLIGLSPGMYLLRLLPSDGHAVETRKVVVH